MNSFIKWFFVHVIHWTLLWCAFGLGIDGAMYTLKFWVWAMAGLSMLLLADAAIDNASKNNERPFQRRLSSIQAWVTLSLLVWFGHIFSALAWGLAMVMIAVHLEAVRRMRKANATSAA